MKPLALKLLVGTALLGVLAYLLVTVALPRLREALSPGKHEARPQASPTPASTGVTGEVTDATREALRKHFEAQKKAQGAKPRP